jgi:peptidoglycan/xylan/chitin deacetylase (PgdA/CDA1 family)
VGTPSSVAAWARRVARSWRSRAAVLVYHRVARAAADPFGQAVDPATFERQLRVARRYGTIMAAAELVERLARGAPIDRALVVTFDDGYADTLSVAAPIAASLDVPVTVFVAVQPVLDGAPFWWDALGSAVLAGEPPAGGIVRLAGRELALGSPAGRARALEELHGELRRAGAARRAELLDAIVGLLPYHGPADPGRPMTEEELRRLAALPGVAVGAHTMTHPSLAALDAAEQRREMSESREALERLLGTRVRLLAYPFGKRGDVSAETRRMARAAGFDAAFTTVPRPVDRRADPYAIPRLTVHEWSDDAFAAKLDAVIGPPPRR